MSNHGPIFMPGDAVYYTGEKNKQALTTKEGKPLRGWIHWFVNGEPEKFVVWFPDTKEQDSYILHRNDLAKARPPKAKEHGGPVVEHIPNRRKASED
jgi:hypothetical protein